MRPLLSVRGLQVRLPTEAGELQAVRGIDFDVWRGRTLCLVGESGCGKSMTSLALMGLLPRSARCEAERLQLDGQDLLRLDAAGRGALRGRRMAMIFQDPMSALNPVLPLGRQLCEAWRLHSGASAAAARERALQLLRRVGIGQAEERLRQYPHQLSGGLRQRVMIAMALMGQPELLIADEPTTALDVTLQAQLLDLLRELQREMGLGLLFITHDFGVVSRIADEVAVMYAGRVVERAATAQLLGAPAHPYTRALLRCVPGGGRSAPRSLLQAIPGVVPSLVGPQTGCTFRNRCAAARTVCAEAVPRRTRAVDGPIGPGAPDGDHSWHCHLDATAIAEAEAARAPAPSAIHRLEAA
jgi:peptide/nickel transport system ATP-binding protein